MTQDNPGIQAVDSPTDSSHAPLYDEAPVMAQSLPRRLKLYAAIAPMLAISAAAFV